MIIVGDVHGCYRTLRALLEKCPKGEEVAIVGDLVDRGADSYSVVQAAMNEGWHVVLGNHERMMIDAVDRGRLSDQSLWEVNGGAMTMLSYKRMANWGPNLEKHVEWMKQLPTWKFFKDEREDGRRLFLSHAGLYDPFGENDPLEQANYQTRNQDILWHRDPIHDFPEIFQVIGHTPVPNAPRIEPHFANVDTGCVFNRLGYTHLTALRFPQMEVFMQENLEFRRPRPAENRL